MGNLLYKIVFFLCCPLLSLEFRSTRTILVVMFLTRVIFWWLILFLLFYMTHFENPSVFVILGVGVPLFTLWLDREYYGSKASSYLQGLNLDVGDKIGIFVNNEQEEGELTKMYMDVFEFKLNNGKLRIASWSFFEEHQYYLIEKR